MRLDNLKLINGELIRTELKERIKTLKRLINVNSRRLFDTKDFLDILKENDWQYIPVKSAYNEIKTVVENFQTDLQNYETILPLINF